MGRLWRLSVVVIVLALAPMQAWGECAWVLWEQMAPNIHQPIEGFRKKDECVDKAQQMRSPGVVYRCLPDTVDPRGAKGGR
jgi:hypothetical protein